MVMFCITFPFHIFPSVAFPCKISSESSDCFCPLWALMGLTACTGKVLAH